MEEATTSGHECYHCKQWIPSGQPHDCWTTTEAALTRDLSEDLRDAWERLRESAVELGEQRIYASHNSIMFSRKACYFFVRPKRSYLEVCVFLDRPLKSPRIHRVMPTSKTKFAHLLRLRHRDEVEAPITDWLREAFELEDRLAARRTTGRGSPATARKGQAAAKSTDRSQPRTRKRSGRARHG